MRQAKRILACLAAGAMLLVCGACGKGGENLDKDEGKQEETQKPQVVVPWDEQTEGTVVSRPQETGEKSELLRDLNFSQGFRVTPFHSNTSATAPWGALTYGGEKAAGDPVWTMAQWGCTHDMREKTEEKFSREGSVLTYDDGGKLLKVDVAKAGTVTLGIKGSAEYPTDAEGNYSERQVEEENFPHILIEQSVGHKIGTESHLYMELEYEVTKFRRLVEAEPKEIHAAQFQWFITLSGGGQTMWFGFSMFDSRSVDGTPPGMEAYDAGKEDNTGLFIYMFSLATRHKAIEADVPTAEVGVKKHVKVDILPLLKPALKAANTYGAMLGVEVSDLSIGSTNIGWELPGSYDVEVKIENMNMYSVL